MFAGTKLRVAVWRVDGLVVEPLPHGVGHAVVEAVVVRAGIQEADVDALWGHFRAHRLAHGLEGVL
jgi:hypothetical protein